MKSPYAKTVGYELLHSARLHRARTAQLLDDLGLFPGQEQVLTALATEDGRTMGDLAEVLRVRPPTASKTVGRLAAQSLVERRAGGSDGRLVRVHLTELGRARAESIAEIWQTLETEAVADLDGKDKKRLRKLLRRVGKNLTTAAGGIAAEDDELFDEAELELED